MRYYTNVVRIGSNILCRGYEDGKMFFEKEEYKPTIYLPSKDENSKFKTLEGTPVEEFVPGNMYEANEYIKTYGKIDNFTFYGMTNWVYNYIANKFPGEMPFDFTQLRVGILDLEWGMNEETGKYANTDLADGEITVMTLWYKDMYYVWGCKPYNNTRTDVEYRKFNDEESMLENFLDFWSSIKLDMVSGWYSEGADIPYLVNRIKRVLGEGREKKLSPYGKVVPDEIFVSAKRKIKTYDIFGINHIDYMAAYKKFSGKQQDNYKLDTIAKAELGRGKLDYSAYGSLNELWEQNPQMYIDYNILDVQVLVDLENKKRFLELVVNLAMTSKVNMIDAFKQTRLWDSIIHAYLFDNNIVVPQRSETGVEIDGQFEGAYVKESRPGMFEWCVSFDFTSLYPSMIMGLNISPETFVEMREVIEDQLVNGEILPLIEEMKRRNLALAGNGAVFRKDIRGFLPKIMEQIFLERKIYKKKMLELEAYLETNRHKMSKEEIKKTENDIAKFNVLQNVKKVNANSGYGAVGNAGFRYYNKDMAEAITGVSRVAIRWMERKFNEFLNTTFKTTGLDYVIITDTDSSVIKLDSLVEVFKSKKPDATRDEIHAFLHKFIEGKIRPFIEESCAELAEYLNFYKNTLDQKLEMVAERGFVVAKKKYAFNVLSSEGVYYESPEMKVKGIEIVRSSTPEFCRKKLKVAVKMILDKKNDELLSFIEEVKTEWMTLGFDEISMPRGCNNLLEYSDSRDIYKSRTPIHVRGALLFNHFVKEKGLDAKYKLIDEGEKIKFCYLKMPNPIFENIISFPDVVPAEFNLEKYIDYDQQFEVAFMGPINIIAQAIELDLEDKNTLDALFA